MADSKRKAPKLRFPGFNDDWEQRKLGDISSSYSGGTPSAGKKSYYGGNIPFIRSAEINKSKTELFLTEDGLRNSSAKLVEVGDILYALYGATSGEVGISQINGAINQAILSIKPHNGYESQFIMQWLRFYKQKIVDKYIQGGQGNLSASIIKDLQMEIPEYVEQVKISVFLAQLDNLITLHQRKLSDVQKLKSGLLQKMFPKNGEKVPEIRFPEFSNDWEQRKFEEVFDFSISTNSFSRAQLNFEEGIVKSVHYGDILVNYNAILDAEKDKIPFITDGTLAKHKNNLLKNCDIIFADAAEDETVGKAVEVNGIQDSYLVSGLHTIVARPKQEVAPYFYGYYINSNSYHKQLLKLMQGTKVSSISKTNLKKTIVFFPNDLKEQEKIGKVFKQLDNLITLHQRKLEHLQQQKKALLQQMFI